MIKNTIIMGNANLRTEYEFKKNSEYDSKDSKQETPLEKVSPLINDICKESKLYDTDGNISTTTCHCNELTKSLLCVVNPKNYPIDPFMNKRCGLNCDLTKNFHQNIEHILKGNKNMDFYMDPEQVIDEQEHFIGEVEKIKKENSTHKNEYYSAYITTRIC
jgi:hypothetical protein